MKSLILFGACIWVAFGLSTPSLHAASEDATFDDGNMLLFVSNNGTFGFDINFTRGEYTGLYYPKSKFTWLMSGGGIWVAGKVNGDWRVTISGDLSEFVPGSGTAVKGVMSPFPIYKITKGENHALDDDYQNWPVLSGAPLDASGNPLIEGSQALWTVFNDLDPSQHGFSISDTPPLGVKVKMYAYTYDNTYQSLDTLLTQTVFFEYTIYNVSDHPIDSCIVTLYADADIGYGSNDLVACDSSLGAGYCYDNSDNDVYFGPKPPVVGMIMLDKLPRAFNYYRAYSRFDPPDVTLDTLPKTIDMINGLTLKGAPYVDPTTNEITRFPFNGNPATDTGWICSDPQDYRIVLNTEPLNLKPGDSTRVKMALLVAQGNTSLESVSRFLAGAAKIKGIYESDTNKPRIELVDSRSNDTLTLQEPIGDQATTAGMVIRNGSQFTEQINIVSPYPFNLKAIPSSFDLGVGEQKDIQVSYTEIDSGAVVRTLDIYSYGLRDDKQSVSIVIDRSASILHGDANNDHSIDLADLLRMVNILYRDELPKVPKRQLDGNCDEIFNLKDIVTILNYLYQQIDLPCPH